jgi:hypothetical protein
VISSGVVNVIPRFNVLGNKASVSTSPGLITLKSFTIVSKPLPAKYCAANEPLKLSKPVVISKGVFRFLFKFNVLGVNASVTTSPGFTLIKSLITVFKPLPDRYWAANEPLNVFTPVVISKGVFKVCEKFNALGVVDALTTSPGLVLI